MTQAAAVIDLEAVRRERQRARSQPVSAPPRRAPVMMPVWVMWVPVWPFA